jgi:hypothetical protein
MEKQCVGVIPWGHVQQIKRNLKSKSVLESSSKEGYK